MQLRIRSDLISALLRFVFVQLFHRQIKRPFVIPEFYSRNKIGIKPQLFRNDGGVNNSTADLKGRSKTIAARACRQTKSDVSFTVNSKKECVRSIVIIGLYHFPHSVSDKKALHRAMRDSIRFVFRSKCSD